jgi:hypothetical protein
MFANLDFPPISCKYKEVNNNVYLFDRIRKKYVLLTPEEWVRQHLVHFIIDNKHYPASLIRIERGIRYNRLLKRTDVLVHDRKGKPLIVFECKSAEHNLAQADLAQVTTYGASKKPAFIALTNGLKHFIWKVDYVNHKTRILDGFPDYEELLGMMDSAI